jgi:hypothetical protein
MVLEIAPSISYTVAEEPFVVSADARNRPPTCSA